MHQRAWVNKRLIGYSYFFPVIIAAVVCNLTTVSSFTMLELCARVGWC